MPTYDYHCPACGVFDALRPMNQSQSPARCPGCWHDADRIIIAAPGLSALSKDRRAAYDTNERASNEPRRSGAHGMSCACCTPVSLSGARSATNDKGANAASSGGAKSALSTALKADIKSKAVGRPWMISH